MTSSSSRAPASTTTVIFECQPCHVFSLPPENFLVSEKWEGLHIWTGALRIVKDLNDGSSSIELIDKENNDAVFGVCPYTKPGGALIGSDARDGGGRTIQSASDSTRCFVIRLEQGDDHAYIGLNFPDRNNAFQFNAALSEARRTEQARLAAALLPVQKHTLQAGETVTVDLNVVKSSGARSAPSAGSTVVPVKEFSLDQTNPWGTRPTGSSRRVSSQVASAGGQGQAASPTVAPPPPSPKPAAIVERSSVAATPPVAPPASTVAAPPLPPVNGPSAAPLPLPKPAVAFDSLFGDISGPSAVTAPTQPREIAPTSMTALDTMFGAPVAPPQAPPASALDSLFGPSSSVAPPPSSRPTAPQPPSAPEPIQWDSVQSPMVVSSTPPPNKASGMNTRPSNVTSVGSAAQPPSNTGAASLDAWLNGGGGSGGNAQGSGKPPPPVKGGSIDNLFM